MVVNNRAKSSRKEIIYHKLVFKTKESYRFLEKATPSSYQIQHLPFCEGVGRPVRKVKESAAIVEIYTIYHGAP